MSTSGMQIRPWDGMGRGVRALITILQGHPPLRLPNVVRLSGLGENLELASGTSSRDRRRTRPSSLVKAVKQIHEADE